MLRRGCAGGVLVLGVGPAVRDGAVGSVDVIVHGAIVDGSVGRGEVGVASRSVREVMVRVLARS